MVIPSFESQDDGQKVLLDTEKSDITMNSVSKKENGDYFRIFQVSMATVEVSSAIFNLLVKYYPDLKKYVMIATYITYSVLTILNFILIAYSFLKLIEIIKSIKNEESCSDMQKKQLASEVLTILATTMWIVIGITSICMLVNQNDVFEGLNLSLGIIAPALGCISAVVRYMIEKDECLKDKEGQKHGSSNSLIAYACIAAFEFIHCICHIIEAIQLNGQTQNIYDFNNIPVIVIQVIIGGALLINEIYEHRDSLIPSWFKKNVSVDSYHPGVDCCMT